MVAAACMSDELDQQLEIAAGLMGIALEAGTIRAFKAARPKGNVIEISSHGGPARAVLVEKKRTPRTFARPGQGAVLPRAGRA